MCVINLNHHNRNSRIIIRVTVVPIRCFDVSSPKWETTLYLGARLCTYFNLSEKIAKELCLFNPVDVSIKRVTICVRDSAMRLAAWIFCLITWKKPRDNCEYGPFPNRSCTGRHHLYTAYHSPAFVTLWLPKTPIFALDIWFVLKSSCISSNSYISPK